MGEPMDRKLFFDRALLPDGWASAVEVTFRARQIAAVRAGLAAPPPGVERHAVAVPGLPNVHSHAFQRGMAGLAERREKEADSFWSWRETMYLFLDRLEPEDVEAIAALAYVEMLESGFTSVGEFHYLHHAPDGRPYADRAELAGRIAAAALNAGLGLTLLPTFYAHGGIGGAPPAPGQRRFVNDLDGFARLTEAAARHLAGDPDAVLGLAPHSLRAVTPEELAALVTAAPPGAPIHIHAAEQEREVEDFVAWSGRRPVEWLLDEAGLDARWCVIHATHMTTAETRRLAGSGAVAGLCPITESNLGDGIFAATDFLSAGGRFAVGSDSNVLIDAGQELRTLEYSQRLRDRRRGRIAPEIGGSVGRALFSGALQGGSQALGRAGGLAEGRRADIVILDETHPALIGRDGDALLDGWVFAAARPPIREVWAGGERVVESGVHRGRAAAAESFRRTMLRLLA
jgi:formimidoylglutamate deiminase